jgi:hypothetical protein
VDRAQGRACSDLQPQLALGDSLWDLGNGHSLLSPDNPKNPVDWRRNGRLAFGARDDGQSMMRVWFKFGEIRVQLRFTFPSGRGFEELII